MRAVEFLVVSCWWSIILYNSLTRPIVNRSLSTHLILHSFLQRRLPLDTLSLLLYNDNPKREIWNGQLFRNWHSEQLEQVKCYKPQPSKKNERPCRRVVSWLFVCTTDDLRDLLDDYEEKLSVVRSSQYCTFTKNSSIQIRLYHFLFIENSIYFIWTKWCANGNGIRMHCLYYTVCKQILLQKNVIIDMQISIL